MVAAPAFAVTISVPAAMVLLSRYSRSGAFTSKRCILR